MYIFPLRKSLPPIRLTAFLKISYLYSLFPIIESTVIIITIGVSPEKICIKIVEIIERK